MQLDLPAVVVAVADLDPDHHHQEHGGHQDDKLDRFAVSGT